MIPRACPPLRPSTPLLLALLLVALFSACASGGRAPESGAASGATWKDAERREGLFVTRIDAERGRVWLELPAPDASGHVARLLYVESLARGLGSNPVGLDRGQLGPARVVDVRRLGERVLVEEPNLGFRARTDSADEVRATRDSFATSVLWAGGIEAELADGRLVVDWTDFCVRDAHGVARRLQASGQGSFRLDADRSGLDPRGCLVFPDNIELEAVLTFASDAPGPEVRSTTPTPEAVTLVQHHSLVRLPDDGFRPRPFDPRAGAWSIGFHDYAAPLDGAVETRLAGRHRLEKADPGAARSPVVRPIVYYVDRGAPEPVRSALVEGASWWSEAFEAAGFEDAFRVELLPEDAHPLDVRYNVIQWVHRQTRGWSYGGGVTDPRTGEIVKGHVSLGSLRVRQDRRIFEGLLGAERTGTGAADDPIELSLARLRQLSAHEVGHTLGLAHNFAASTYGRASVMDYPAPLVTVGPDGELDVSQAYGVGVGAWDRHAIAHLYSEAAPGEDEASLLEGLVRAARDAGLVYLSDADARPSGAAEPRGNLWDNGADPLEALEDARRVRAVALARFGEANLVPGRPLAELEETLAPLYFHHRYQIDAAHKLVGGLRYQHRESGDGGGPMRPVEPDRQRAAIEALLGLLEPSELELPVRLVRRLPPRPPGHSRGRELFGTRTAPAFDELGAAASLADHVLGGLLQPERCARVADQAARDGEALSLPEHLDALLGLLARPEPDSELRRALAREVEAALVERLIVLAGDARAPHRVRARVEDALATVADLERESAHRAALAARARRFLERAASPGLARPEPAAPPPGSPIGAEATGAWGLGACGFDPAPGR